MNSMAMSDQGIRFFLLLTLALLLLPSLSWAKTDANRRTAPGIAAGYYHSVALRNDGTVWTWGHNDYGSLGNGTTSPSNAPVQVAGLADAISVVAGGYHTAALKSDGTVWAWGYNFDGQLGTSTNVGTYDPNPIPVKVVGLEGITAIATNHYHTVALKDDGTVWTWGNNSDGELGNGTNTNTSSPVRVSGLNGIVSIAAGYNHTVAIRGDGTVWTWGDNSLGQLGDGTTSNSTTPVQVTGLGRVIAVTAGEYHTVALKSDGTVWAWGGNGNGELGNSTNFGTGYSNPTPLQVTGVTGVTAIAADSRHVAALKDDGTVWTWGRNAYGQLGNGSTTDSCTPVQVTGLNGVAAVAAGGEHAVALKSDGTVSAWGYNLSGELGNGTNVTSYTPVQVSGVNNLRRAQIAAGTAEDFYTMALKSDGTVWAVGQSYYGQLGNGTNYSTIPVQVSGLNGVIDISAGYYHSIALMSDGTVASWGQNNFGQLGIGTTTDSNIPVQLTGLSGVTAIAAGDYHTLALKSDGSVWAWGGNFIGQLGNDSITDTEISTTPVQVSGLTDIKTIAAALGYSMALKADGTVWHWGFLKDHGSSGGVSGGFSMTPVQVAGLTDVVAVAAGRYHQMALKSDGTFWAWGGNYNGEFGIGSSDSDWHPNPVQVSGISNIVSLSVGNGYSLALKSDGSVYSWGDNNSGQLGIGTTTNSSSPIQVTGLSGVSAISAGQNRALALKSDGINWGWGEIWYGFSPPTTSSTPVQAGPLGSVPMAPVILTATPGNAQVIVSFMPPYGNGGSDITGYTVISNPAGGVDLDAGSIIPYHVVTGLTNGIPYTFTVTATNSIGTGPPSAPSESVTPLGSVPAAPLGVTATPGNGLAVVSFFAPYDGGSAITGYTVISNPAGGVDLDAGSTSLSRVITGLTNGIPYTFTVTATNSIGTGPPSAPSESVTPYSPYSLTINVTGSGTVLTVPFTDLACTGNCIRDFIPGSVVTLTAAPSSGYTFTGWSGACSGTGDCQVTMDASKSVTAAFIAAYQLDVTKNGTGTGSVTVSSGTLSWNGNRGTSTNYNGTSVTLLASPDSTSQFSSWSGCDTVFSNTCTVTMNAARSVIATFADITPPDTSITSHPASPTSSTSFAFAFTATEPSSAFECRLNNGAWGACASPYSNGITYPMCTICRTDTPMTFTVRAKDAAGNYDPTPAAYSWTITNPLNTPIDSVVDGGVVQLPATDIASVLNFSRAVSFTLKGGFTGDYLTVVGVSTIHGSVTISGGTVNFENIVIVQ